MSLLQCPTVISSPAFRTSQHCLLQHWVWHITLARGKLDRENLKCSRECLQQSVLMQMFTASVLMQTFTAVCAHANFYCSLCSCKLLLQSVLMQTFTAVRAHANFYCSPCSCKLLLQSVLMQTFTAVRAHANFYCSLCSCKLLLQSVLMQTFTAVLTSASQHVNCEAGAWSDTASVKCDLCNGRLLWSTHLTVLICVQLTHTASGGCSHPILTH